MGVIAIRSKLKSLKQEFELSYVELASLTNINHSGIKNFVEGETEKPRDETLDCYQALIDVLKILSTRFSSKPLTKKAILRRESDAFSGLSIIQYSKQLGPDGIFTLRSELRRMYE